MNLVRYTFWSKLFFAQKMCTANNADLASMVDDYRVRQVTNNGNGKTYISKNEC